MVQMPHGDGGGAPLPASLYRLYCLHRLQLSAPTWKDAALAVYEQMARFADQVLGVCLPVPSYDTFIPQVWQLQRHAKL
jgi:hypothetical protein